MFPKFRTCKFALVCGSSSVHEEAYCYTDGSLCEDWYKQGKSLSLVEKYRNGQLDEEDLNSGNSVYAAAAAEDERIQEEERKRRKNQQHQQQKQFDGSQCGLRNPHQQSHEQQEETKSEPEFGSYAYKTKPAPWALKIIGKK